ncbi:ketopantoate reductase-like protein [Dichomitus squalens]|nr:ketopantoate reductase-like protein [Dichomitus squalens]
MRIHVVGLGAVGSFVAFHLRRTLHPKHTVFALHHKFSAPTISKEHPIVIESEGVVHSQSGVEHLAFTLSPQRARPDLNPRLDPLRQPHTDLRVALDCRNEPHELHRIYGAIESLVVTTKAHAVPRVIAALSGHLSRNSTVVLLHNGMGMYEKLVEEFFPDPYDRPNFVLATNTHGLWRKDVLHVVHSGVGEIQLGIVPDPHGRDYEAAVRGTGNVPSWKPLSLDDIASISDEHAQSVSPRYLSLRNTISALTGARALGATWRPYDDVQTAMRRKLVVNCFVNPLSALLQCKNGDLLSSNHSRWVLDHLCKEAEHVFRAQLAAEVKEMQKAYEEMSEEEKAAVGPPRPQPYPRALTSLSLMREVERVVDLTRENYSSMYWDVKLGKPTEIKYLNGYLRKLGLKYSVRTGVNDILFGLTQMRTAIPFVGKPS